MTRKQSSKGSKSVPFSNTQNFTDQVPYWDLDQGVMFLHGVNRVEIGIEINPPSAVFLSDLRMRSIWNSAKLALRNTPAESRVRVIVATLPLRDEIIKKHFARKTTDDSVMVRMMNAKRNMLMRMRRRKQLFERRNFVTLALPIPKRRKGLSMSAEEYKAIIERAHNYRDQLIQQFSQIGFNPRPMSDQDIFEMCWQYFNPDMVMSGAPRYIPIDERTYYPEKTLESTNELEVPTLRRQILSSTLTSRSHKYISIGNSLARIIAFKRLPDETRPNSVGRIMEALGPVHSYLIIDFHHDPLAPLMQKLGSRLESFRGAAEVKNNEKFSMSVDVSTEVAAESLHSLLTHLNRSNEHAFTMAVTMVFFADDEEDLRDKTNRVVSAINNVGAAMPIIGNLQNLALYRDQVAPFNGKISDFKFKTIEQTGGDFFPIAGEWRGVEPMVLMGNRYGGVTAIDLFHKECTNWNGFVSGGSGAGKTYLMQMLASSAIAEEIEMFIIDRGYGYAPLMEAINAPIIPMEPGSNIVINPFDLDEGEIEPDEEKLQFVLSIVRTMINLSEDNARRDLENIILISAIRQTFAQGIDVQIDGYGNETYSYVGATMSMLVKRLSSLEEISGKAAEREHRMLARELSTRLSRWTGASIEGKAVDGQTNININNPQMYFETSGLIHNPELGAVMLLLLSNLIFGRFKKNPFDRKMVIFDEAWALLANPEARALIVELYRRARRYNCAVYGVSQGVSDFAEIPALIQQANFFFIGFNSGTEQDLQVIEAMKGNDAALRAYKSLTQSKGEYSEFLAFMQISNQVQGDVIQVRGSQVERWVFTTNGPDMERRLRIADQSFNGNIALAATAMGEADEAALDGRVQF